MRARVTFRIPPIRAGQDRYQWQRIPRSGCSWRLVALGLVLGALGCGGRGGPGRVAVLGLDGMDPEVVDLLVREGKLRHFARLAREGAHGRLRSSAPLLSPIIWTTIATGKTPDAHGIGHFVAVNQQTGQELPVTSRMRKVKAVWNIASDAGRSVAVVGWWATWPAETVRGAVVSDHTCYHFLFPEGTTGGDDPAGMTHPPALVDEIRPMIRRPSDLRPDDLRGFVTVTAEEFGRPFAFTDDLGHFKWARATADTYRRIGLHLWRTQRPDLLLVYVEGVDSTSHLFGHLFRTTGLAGELAAQQARYGGAVEAMYRYADALVGEYLAALGPDATLVVLSDHGFELGALPEDPSRTRDMRRVSERFHRVDGILYLAGRGVRPGASREPATILDVAPTLLALLGLSPAKDMPGRVLTEALDLPATPRTVATYETGTQAAGGGGDAPVDPAILARLRSLGYLDARSPRGDRNLAAMHFEAGRHEEAARAYAEIVRQDPDDGDAHASLAGALGALGRYDEALTHLETAIRLRPLNPEARHNRGVIYEKQGKTAEAIAEYRAALRYNPSYEPSQRALARLTGSPSPHAPATAAQQLASRIAKRAEEQARRGDYDGAMKTLDEAERIAPRYVLLHQYRANVAFLKGDRAAAIAALKRGLELEPDNALFRTNLERLERPPLPGP
jgi:tetratricopeptide (TPR) repeat protein